MIEKLNDNPITLTDEEWQIVSTNPELFDYLIGRLINSLVIKDRLDAIINILKNKVDADPINLTENELIAISRVENLYKLLINRIVEGVTINNHLSKIIDYISNKINNEPIEVLDEEWNLILQNENLKSLFINRIKNGAEVKSKIPKKVVDFMISSNLMPLYVKTLKEKNYTRYIEYINYINHNYAMLSQEELINAFGIDNLLRLTELIPDVWHNNLSYEEEVNYRRTINSFIARIQKMNIFFIDSNFMKKLKLALNEEKLTEEYMDNNFDYYEKMYILESNNYFCEKLAEKCNSITLFNKDDLLHYSISRKTTESLKLRTYIAKKSVRDEKDFLYLKEHLLDKYYFRKLIFLYKKPISREIALELIQGFIPKFIEDDSYMLSILLKNVTDSDRMQLLETIEEKELRKVVISTIKDPKLLKKHFKKVPLLKKNEAIISMDNDEFKEQYINPINPKMSSIIRSLKSDNLKEYYLHKYYRLIRKNDKIDIILSFKDYSYIEFNALNLQTDEEKEAFIIMSSHIELNNRLIKNIKDISALENCVGQLYLWPERKFDDSAYIYLAKTINNPFSQIKLFFRIPPKYRYIIASKTNQLALLSIIKKGIQQEINMYPYYKYIQSDNELLKRLIAHPTFEPYNPEYDVIVKRVANNQNINYEKLLKIVKRFGMDTLKLIKTDNIKYLMSMNDEKIDKFLELFSQENTTINPKEKNDALYGIFLREFNLKRSNVVNFFSDTMHDLADNKDITRRIEILNNYVNLKDYNTSTKELIEGLNKRNEKIILLFRRIVSDAIDKVRTQYIKEKMALYDAQHNQKNEKKNIIKYIYDNIPIDIIVSDVYNCSESSKELFSQEELSLLQNSTLLRTAILIKKSKSAPPADFDKKSFRIVESILKKVYEDIKISGVLKEQRIIEATQSELFSILSEMNIKELDETVLEDDMKYKKLQELLKERKLIGWINGFEKEGEEADIEVSNETIASIISHFRMINRDIHVERNTTLSNAYIRLMKNLRDYEPLLKEYNNRKEDSLEIIKQISELINKYSLPEKETIQVLVESAYIYGIENIETAKKFFDSKIPIDISVEKLKDLSTSINNYNWEKSITKLEQESISPDKELLEKVINTIISYRVELKNYNIEQLINEFFTTTAIYIEEGLDKAKEFINPEILNVLGEKKIEELLVMINELNKKTKTKNTVSSGSLMDMGECYSTQSSRNMLLFGRDDFKLLRRNPEPNRANMKSKERMKLAREYIIKMYNRKTITVPPSRNTYKLKSGKEIGISVGDLHHMENLTYGERTKACMRIGGHAKSLFETCLTNPNGFHIRFYDPLTHKLISRVSGFRNGNTVFLNELRNSLSQDYNNEEVVEACKIIAERLVEDTRKPKSNHPIDNVVISTDYAMQPHSRETIDLKIQDLDKGLPKIYYDIHPSSALLLASSNPDNSLVPIVLGPNKVDEYEGLRRETKEAYGKEALLLINQIRMLETHLKGGNIDRIAIIESNDIIYCIQGEDWYISVDRFGNIEEYVASSSPSLAKANQEVKEHLLMIKQQLEQKGIDSFEEENRKGMGL